MPEASDTFRPFTGTSVGVPAAHPGGFRDVPGRPDMRRQLCLARRPAAAG
jgi:hypothetical protein